MPYSILRPARWSVLFTGLVLTSSLLASALAQGRDSVILPAGTRVLKDLAYVEDGHERQKLDLYLPPGDSAVPLILFIHGGAFREGDKADPPALRYLEQGYAVASLNYRLSQHAVFPAQIQDVKAAVRWLRARASAFNLNPDAFGVWGISAGGHLAAMLGTAGDVPEWETVGGHRDVSSRVQAVVDWFGPTDFLQMDAHRTPNGQQHNPPDSPESQLIGGPIQEHPELVARANPVTYVTADDPPFLIVHGLDDPLVPHHQSTLLMDALLAAGNKAAFLSLMGAGHGGPAFETSEITNTMNNFFALHLKGEDRRTRPSGQIE